MYGLKRPDKPVRIKVEVNLKNISSVFFSWKGHFGLKLKHFYI